VVGVRGGSLLPHCRLEDLPKARLVYLIHEESPIPVITRALFSQIGVSYTPAASTTPYTFSVTSPPFAA
jgi:hypothetical protein